VVGGLESTNLLIDILPDALRPLVIFISDLMAQVRIVVEACNVARLADTRMVYWHPRPDSQGVVKSVGQVIHTSHIIRFREL
jgi:hypothetical protein